MVAEIAMPPKQNSQPKTSSSNKSIKSEKSSAKGKDKASAKNLTSNDSNESNEFTCSIQGCTCTFMNQEHLDRHINKPHNEFGLLTCVHGCQRTFKSDAELLRHKVIAEQHDYCAKCDVDCEDWEAFVKHKVESEKHICCPMCGEDFKSIGGLERHVSLMHQKDQNIVCPGCDLKFTRAGALMSHFENGSCRNIKEPERQISREDFNDHLTRKTLLHHILNDPNCGSSFGNVTTAPTAVSGSSTVAPSESGHSVDGGVHVDHLDTIEEEEAALVPALQPTVKSSEPLTPLRSNARRNDVNDSAYSAKSFPSVMSKLTIKDEGKAETDTLADNDFPAIGTTAPSTTTTTHSRAPSTSGSVWGNPWGQSVTSSTTKLFPNAKPTPTPMNFKAGIQARDDEYRERHGLPAINRLDELESGAGDTANIYGRVGDGSETVNMFRTRFWDPKAPAFSADNWFNQLLQRYECPFPECEFLCQEPVLLSNHLQSATHAPRHLRCVSCLRIFKSRTALIQHCESASTKCRINRSEQYAKILDRFSGGFLNVKEEERREVGDGGVDADEDGEMRVGQPQLKYEAVRPPGFW